MQTNVGSIDWLGGKQASRVDSSSQVAAHAYHPSHNFDAAGTAMNFAPSCRPWKCGYLLRPLATFKLSTWASELKVADSLAYAQRGWVNVDLDKIEWESCCAYLIFKALTSWFPIEVANAGESFAEQLDAARQNNCPWRGNDYADSLVQFHLTQSVLQDQQYCRYVVQLPVGYILTWEMLKIQKKCDTDARAPSWTWLNQDQINASGNTAKQLQLYTIPEHAFPSDFISTTVTLKETKHKITLIIEDSKVLWDLVISIENRKWCRLLCSSPRVKERLMVLQLFVLSGTPCSMLHVVSASQSPVPWDPASLKFFKSPTLQRTAWGQAVF